MLTGIRCRIDYRGIKECSFSLSRLSITTPFQQLLIIIINHTTLAPANPLILECIYRTCIVSNTIYHNRCRISCKTNFHIYVIRTPHKLHDKIIKLWDTNNYSLKHRHFNCIIRIINMSKGYFSITFFLIRFTITDKSKNTGCRIIIRLWSRMYPTWLIDNSQITGISTIYFHIVHSTCSIRMHSWLCNLN